jgi:long-chain acyl-CoA synthetase
MDPLRCRLPVCRVVDVPIYTTLSDDSVRYILDDSRAKILILQDEISYERLLPSIKDCRSIEKIILLRAAGNDCLLSLNYLETAGENLKQMKPGLIGELRDAVGPSDIATLIYTSGTTGRTQGRHADAYKPDL